jgi:hypothetical protein
VEKNKSQGCNFLCWLTQVREKVLFEKVLFEKVLFEKVLFEKVLFEKVLFEKVLFEKVLFEKVGCVANRSRLLGVWSYGS